MSTSSNRTSRDAILGRIRKSLGRTAGEAAPMSVTERLASPKANPVVPKRAQLAHDQQVELFEKMATSVSATVSMVVSDGDIPREVARFLADHNLPARVKTSPDAAVSGLPWSDTALEVRIGIAGAEDAVSVTPSFAGVAETGSLMLRSGASTPYTLNMLPDTHIAVLRVSDIVGTYEEVWARLREKEGHGNMPRTFLWVTGPSRTGDIEQTIQLGAHGPRRLHIVLVDDTKENK
ncbi:MAG: LUD domain-containing protein [Thalassospira sp.]|uniref:LutC/YkgG family protein n=1 Tax=Thalassospira sp. TaxID=1912094 RepID=UPI0032ECED92